MPARQRLVGTSLLEVSMAHRSGESSGQTTLFPVMLDELVDDGVVRAIDVWALPERLLVVCDRTTTPTASYSCDSSHE